MNQTLSTLQRACVIGAGGIGTALYEALCARDASSETWLLHRGGPTHPTLDDDRRGALRLDVTEPGSVEQATSALGGEFDLVIVATGLLHDGHVAPEKSFRQIDADAMMRVLAVNTVGPAVVARHFLPRLPRDRAATFAALSARVGSIGDNRLGGWHSYRASKAALNMLLRNFAIELRRSHKLARIVGLHPGTVDTRLSEPFQRNVPEGKLFTSAHSAQCLLNVIDGLGPEDSGGVFDWAGLRVEE